MSHQGKTSGVAVRPAALLDAVDLPAIENSAGESFRQIRELAHLVDGDDHPATWYRDLIARGASWVATTPNRSVAFLCASIEGDALHIWELWVRQEWQRRGMGRALVDTAVEAARRRGLAAATLTTFRDVPWNAPFYSRLGFEILPDAAIRDHLAVAVRDDAAHGLPMPLRCAMRLLIG